MLNKKISMRISSCILTLLLSLLYSSFLSATDTPAIAKKAYIFALGEFEKGSGWANISTERDVFYLEKAFESRGFNKSNIHTYLNQKTTKKDVIEILGKAEKTAKKGEIIHVHFSGYGALLERNYDYFEKQRIKELDTFIYNERKKLKIYSSYRSSNAINWLRRPIIKAIDSANSIVYNLKFDRAIVMYDSPVRPLVKDSLNNIIQDEREKYLRSDEIIKYIKALSETVGPSGQIVLSFDACHSGPNENEIQEEKGITIANRGGVFEMMNQSLASPIVIFSSSLSHQLNFEIRDSSGISVGAWCYAFYLSAKKKEVLTYRDLAEEISKQMSIFETRQTPVAAGNLDARVYHHNAHYAPLELASSNFTDNSISANVYALSIGISDYILDNKNVFVFENAASDAKHFIEFLQREHQALAINESTFYGKALVDQEASKENIIKELNQIISRAKPEDYFFFNFSGLSWELKGNDSLTDIYFYPTLPYDVSDSAGLNFKKTQDKLGLKQLKELFEFISAQNQLIISEAGATPNFQKIFAKSLIEISPTLAELSKRNRIIIAPKDFGYDLCYCINERINQAPLSYYLSLNQELGHNIFSLFSADPKIRKAYEYEVIKREVECQMHQDPYTTFFHEREFVEMLQFFTPEEVSKNRGAAMLQRSFNNNMPRFGEKHALIIGINDYKKGAPTRDDLNNPIEDAKDIEVVLSEMYGFNTKLMLDAELDSVLAVLKNYSNTLKENDQFVLFLAGHGDYDQYFFDDGFVVFSNSLSRDKDPNRRTYLPFVQLRNIIDNLPPKQVLLMVDICFGGAFDSKISAGSKRSGQASYEDVSLTRMLQHKIDLKTRIVLSSGSVNEVPDGFKGRNSPFASRIISGLRTGGGDRKVLTTIQLFEFVQWLPSKPVRGELPGNEGGAEFFLIAN